MADYFEDDDDQEDEYFVEVVEDDLTGKEPKFFRHPDVEMTPEFRESCKVNELVRQYREVRAQLATEKKSMKERETRLKLQLHIISSLIGVKAEALGVDTFATEHGTAFKQLKEKFPVTNWDELCQYIKETSNFSVLQKRTSPNMVKEIREADGKLPPGVECISETVFSVRAPAKRAKK